MSNDTPGGGVEKFIYRVMLTVVLPLGVGAIAAYEMLGTESSTIFLILLTIAVFGIAVSFNRVIHILHERLNGGVPIHD